MVAKLAFPEINHQTADKDIKVYLQELAAQADLFQKSEDGSSWAIDLILEARRRGIEIPEAKKAWGADSALVADS